MSFISSLTLMPSNLDIEIKTGWIERHSEQHNKAWVLAWFENSGVYAGKKVGFRFQQTRIGIPILSLDGAPKGNHFSCLWPHLLVFKMSIKMSSSMSCLRFRNWRQIYSLDPDRELNVRLLGEVGKNSFIAFPVKQGHGGLIPSKLCDPVEGIVRSLQCSRSRAWSPHGLSSVWLVMRWLGVGIIHLLPTSLGSVCLWSAYSFLLPAGGGFSICKTAQRYFCMYPLNGRASPIAQLVKNLPAMRETLVQFLGSEDPLEKR